jgi:hypothetical protein
MEKTLNHNDLESEIIESFEGGVNVIDEARREWYSLNDYTRTMYDAFNDTDEGKDLQAIGVGIFARGYRALLLNRQGGTMADV